MNRLDAIAFEVAKRLLRRGNERIMIVDHCPALLDLVQMTKEMMLGSSVFCSRSFTVREKTVILNREATDLGEAGTDTNIDCAITMNGGCGCPNRG